MKLKTKKSKIVLSLIVAALLTGSISATAIVKAVNIEGSRTGETQINGKFIATDPQPPAINPTKPDEIESSSPGYNYSQITGNSGSLTLDEIMDNLNFGTHGAYSGDLTTIGIDPDNRPQASDPNAGNFVLQFSDYRVKNGYSIAPVVSYFTDENGNQLEDVKLNFAKPTGMAGTNGPLVQGQIGDKVGDGYNYSSTIIDQPTVYARSYDANVSDPSVSGDPTMLVDATSYTTPTGKGTWKILYSPNDLSLTVPSYSRIPGNYSSKIVWALIKRTD